jgi:cytochrome c oxidase subunit 2
MSPTNIFAPASTPAEAIAGLSLLVLEITGAIFVVVCGLLIYLRGLRSIIPSTTEPYECVGAVMWVSITFIYLVPAIAMTVQALSPARQIDGTPGSSWGPELTRCR